MLAIDVASGEEYLWLSSHAQSDDVARYMAHLTLEMDERGVERLEMVLDQKATLSRGTRPAKPTAATADKDRIGLYLPASLFSQTQCGRVCYSLTPTKVPAPPALQHENGPNRTTPNKGIIAKTTALHSTNY
jgi:hypothetical protein